MGFTMERHHNLNSSDNNLDLCLRRPTNFSIEHILSSKSTTVSSKSGGLALNKVPQNPWLSRGPRLFDPNLCKSQKSLKIISAPALSAMPPAFPSFPSLDYNKSAFDYLSVPRHPSFQNFFYPKIEPAPFGFSECSAVKPKMNEINNNNTNILTFNGQMNYLFHNSDRTIGEGQHTGDEEVVDKKPTLLLASDSLFDMTFKCSVCEKIFGSSETLDVHLNTHKTQRYECKECGRGFSQLRNYKYHLSVHRGTKEFSAKCPECNKTFNDKGYLSSHLKIHRNKKEYQCPHCPKCFNQRVAFNMHVRIHTGIKPHKCAECSKRFSRKMLLKQHLRTHSGEKPYQCSVCGKTFADRSNMTLHHRLHSGIKPFSCQLCPKSFTKKHHLKTHLNYHTGYKPYICPHVNCGQAFTQSSNMRTHAKKCPHKSSTVP